MGDNARVYFHLAHLGSVLEMMTNVNGWDGGADAPFLALFFFSPPPPSLALFSFSPPAPFLNATPYSRCRLSKKIPTSVAYCIFV